MAKRVLLVWEIGAGQGHRLKLGWIARALRMRGCRTVFALRRPESTGGLAEDGTVAEVHQAPVWPGELDPTNYRLPGRPASRGDGLGALGIGENGVFETMLRAWDGLLAATKPDLIVADAAPACLAAARGRTPTLAIGNGFTLPPATLERFPILASETESTRLDERELLDRANEGLRATGRPPLHALPQLYAADRRCIGTFAEFDPYSAFRDAPLAAPWLPEWKPHSVAMERSELFGYFGFRTQYRRTIFAALAILAAQGLRIRVYVPGLSRENAEWLTARGVHVEPQAMSLAEIQTRAGLALSHGSLGFVSFALAAGIPQIVVPAASAAEWTGGALEGIGTGRSVQLGAASPAEPALFAQVVREAFDDQDRIRVAKQRAPDFARRISPPAAETAANLAAELL